MNNDIKERFEVLWYMVAQSMIPAGLLQFINYFFVPGPKNIGFFFAFIIMFVLRWVVTGRHVHLPFTMPSNMKIAGFYFISLMFWAMVSGNF